MKTDAYKCTIAPLVEESTTTIKSIYSFYLSVDALKFSKQVGATHIRVDQVCGTFRNGNWGDDDAETSDKESSGLEVDAQKDVNVLPINGLEYTVSPCIASSLDGSTVLRLAFRYLWPHVMVAKKR